MKTKTTTLAVAVLTLAALPFSALPVEPTYSLQVARSGLETTPLSMNDAGVLEVRQILDSVMEHAAPNTALLTDMESALLGRYGSGSVAVQVFEPEYYWDYDPRTDTWIFICIQESRLLVDDGGATPVVARVNPRVPYVDQ